MLGIAALAILLAFTTSIIGSSEYRQLSTVDTVLRSAAESTTTQIQQDSSTMWASCVNKSTISFASPNYVPPSGYTATVSSITYWNAATSSFGACSANGVGSNSALLVQVTVTYKGSTYSISFVVDDPLTPPVTQSGAATHLVFIGQPGSTISGSPISPPPVVAVEDAANVIVTSDLSPVHIAITPGTGTSGAVLSSNCSGIEFYGVVTFSNCSISLTGSNYTLTATDGILTPGDQHDLRHHAGACQPARLLQCSVRWPGSFDHGDERPVPGAGAGPLREPDRRGRPGDHLARDELDRAPPSEARPSSR